MVLEVKIMEALGKKHNRDFGESSIAYMFVLYENPLSYALKS
jgi:hypothetical protein